MTSRSLRLDADRVFIAAIGLAIVVLLLVFVAWPMLIIVGKSLTTKTGFGLDNYWRVFGGRKFATVTWNSFAVSTTVTVITVALAFVYSYALTRSAMPFKGAFRFLATLPVFAPSLVQGIGLIFLFGRNGLINTTFDLEIKIYGFWGIVIANVLYSLPQAVLLISTALAVADARTYEAATVLGAGPVRKFFDITLPSVKFGLLAAAFLVFTIALTDFGNPMVIGADYTVLANDIYNQVSGQMNFQLGSVVAIVLLAPALLAFQIERIANKRQFALVADRSVPLAPKKSPLFDACMFVAATLIVLPIVAVIGMVVYASFVKGWPYNLTLTLDNYLNNTAQNGYEPLVNSVLVSLIAAVIGVVTTMAAAFVIRRDQGVVGRMVNGIGLLPAAVPGMVLGLAYIFAFNKATGPFSLIYDTLLMLALCNVFHYFSQGMLTASTSLRQISSSFDEASACLGGRVVDTLRLVTLPLVMPTLLAVGIFFFMRSMVTLSGIIFLVSPGTNLAAVTVMLLDDAGATTHAAAYSTLIMLVVIGSLVLLNLVLRLLGKDAPRAAI
jgi:iron(III) transport system permease protein